MESQSCVKRAWAWFRWGGGGVVGVELLRLMMSWPCKGHIETSGLRCRDRPLAADAYALCAFNLGIRRQRQIKLTPQKGKKKLTTSLPNFSSVIPAETWVCSVYARVSIRNGIARCINQALFSESSRETPHFICIYIFS